jgi:hypothetical protein
MDLMVFGLATQALDSVNDEAEMVYINNRINREFCPKVVAEIQKEIGPISDFINAYFENPANFKNTAKFKNLREFRLLNPGACRGLAFNEIVERHIRNLSLFDDDRFLIFFDTPCDEFFEGKTTPN